MAEKEETLDIPEEEQEESIEAQDFQADSTADRDDKKINIPDVVCYN